MFNSITTKTLYEKRWFLLGWMLGIITMAGITIAFYPSIKDQVGQLLASVPKQLQSVTGSADDYRTMAGYIGSGVFDLRIPLLTLTMAIILAINISSGEESNGQLDQLLAQPVSRTRIVLEKWLAFTLIIIASHIALFISIVLLVVLIGETASISMLAGATLMATLLAIVSGSLALMASFATGKKGLSIAVSSLIIFGSYLLTSFATQLEWLRTTDNFSIFHYYKASAVIQHGIVASHVTVLLGIIVFCILIAIIGFRRRDVQA